MDGKGGVFVKLVDVLAPRIMFVPVPRAVTIRQPVIGRITGSSGYLLLHELLDIVQSPAIAIANVRILIIGVIHKFDNAVFQKEMRCIHVYPENRLVYEFYDGHTKEAYWKDPSRRDSWTPEMKARAAEQMRRRYAK